jgi:hypothetical protein
MLNCKNNDREQNWLLLSPRVKRAESDWRATVTQDGKLKLQACYKVGLVKITPKKVAFANPLSHEGQLLPRIDFIQDF